MRNDVVLAGYALVTLLILVVQPVGALDEAVGRGGLTMSGDGPGPPGPVPEGHAATVEQPPASPPAPVPNINYYWTYTYTHSDMTIFAYVNNTQVVVRDSGGAVKWSGTLNKGERQSLLQSNLGSPGVYEVNATMPYGVLVGDHLSTYVMGYYALDYWGRGASTQFYTYQANWGSTAYDPHFIVFSCEDNTYVEVRNTATSALVWSGTLNAGQRYDSTSIDNMYATVNSTKPVTVLSYTDQGYYVPACDTQRFTGQRFYTYAGRAGGWSEGASIVAYQDNTQVSLKYTDTGSVIWSGTLNAGQVYTYNAGATGKFLTVESDKNVTFTIEPYGPYMSGYYHSLYAYDGESGTGIGKLFYHPAITGSNSKLIVFSYDNNSQVKITNPVGTVVWSGTLNAGQYTTYVISSNAGVYKIESTGYSSVLFDWGDLAGADFAPVFFSLQPIPIYVTQTPNPSIVASGGQSTLSVHVNDVVTSIWKANVAFTPSCGGVSPGTATSDVSGNLIVSYTAPSVGTKTVCSVNATASKQGYVPGYDIDNITVNAPDPPTLYTYAFANPGVVKSQGTSQVRVLVTDGFNPVNGVQVNLSVSPGGGVTPATGQTNANGEFFSTFTAPATGTNQTVVVITADASLAGYQDGQGQTQVTVLPSGTTTPVLNVSVSPFPKQVLAGRTSSVTVKVTDGPTPVQGATVYLNATNGSLNPRTGITNVNGEFVSTFTAPNVSRVTQVMLIASAQKSGYIAGGGQDVISVYPADLIVNVSVSPKMIYSGTMANVSVDVSNPIVGPIANATVNLTTTPAIGNITPLTGLTDAQGRFTAVYDAPNVSYNRTVIIRASVSKPTYTPGSGQVDLKIVPYPVLYVSVVPEPDIIGSGGTSTVRVLVQDARSGAAVPNATVNMSLSGGGSITPTQGVTNASGGFQATFTAPTVNITTYINVTAFASRSNYISGNDTAGIRVDPRPRPVVKVKAPNGGENWSVSTQHDVWWDASGGSGYLTVDILYSVSGSTGPWTLLAQGLNNTGVYTWTLPVVGTTHDAFIRVDVRDSAGMTAGDVSDAAFTIYNPADYEPRLERVEVTPASVTVNVLSTVQFHAKGYDPSGREIPGLKFVWDVSSPDLGSITSTGRFKSSNVETTGEVSATASSGGSIRTGYAQVTVSKSARSLERVVITPASEEVALNTTLDLTATALDDQGDELPDARFSWMVSEGDGGTIAPITGNRTTFTASSVGYAVITVTASYNGVQVSASANITVSEGGPHQPSPRSEGVDPWVLAGAVAGAVAAALLLLFLFFYFRKRKKKTPVSTQYTSPFPSMDGGPTPVPVEASPFPEWGEAPPGDDAPPVPLAPAGSGATEKFCPDCGSTLPATARFCNTCGGKVAG